jgi:hypothetical protein
MNSTQFVKVDVTPDGDVDPTLDCQRSPTT